MRKKKLKPCPCPFCGSKVDIVDNKYASIGKPLHIVSFFCKQCKVKVYMKDIKKKNEAIMAWNTRK